MTNDELNDLFVSWLSENLPEYTNIEYMRDWLIINRNPIFSFFMASENLFKQDGDAGKRLIDALKQINGNKGYYTEIN